MVFSFLPVSGAYMHGQAIHLISIGGPLILGNAGEPLAEAAWGQAPAKESAACCVVCQFVNVKISVFH